MFGVSCYVEMENFNEYVGKQEARCTQLLEYYFDKNLTETSCPPHFDGNYCWPITPSMSQAKIRCPIEDYADEIMSRWCSTNITEIIGRNITVLQWHNAHYGRCSLLRSRTVYIFALAVQDEGDSYLDWWHEKFTILDQLGYGLSTLSLILALLIFWKFSQLQDTRVKVHINLFTAMLLQAVMSIIYNVFYGCKIFFTMMVNSNGYDYDDSQICRALMILSHYFELSTFAWLLIEGWYFYNFISRAPYLDFVSIKRHLIVGWGLPLLVVIPWTIAHIYSTQTNFCWVDTDYKVNIVAIPVMLIISVNLCFFILNVRIIFIKMKSTYMSHKRLHYWRWIKSSLMLVPLFGTLDILYAIWPWIENQCVKIVVLLIVRVICAFQGCIVASLYCFANGHVKREIRRAWRNWKMEREINSEILKQKNNSINSMNGIKYKDDINSYRAKFRHFDSTLHF